MGPSRLRKGCAQPRGLGLGVLVASLSLLASISVSQPLTPGGVVLEEVECTVGGTA